MSELTPNLIQLKFMLDDSIFQSSTEVLTEKCYNQPILRGSVVLVSFRSLFTLTSVNFTTEVYLDASQVD